MTDIPTPEEPRPLVVRLAEYAFALRATAAQMVDTAEAIEAKYGKKASNTESLRDGARLYALFATDIDKIVGGEELKQFIVEGEI
jgi:hypothetical protein